MLMCFFKDFIYLRESKREQELGETQRDREAGSPPSREPNAGFDPEIPGPEPEWKTDASLTEPPRHPSMLMYFSKIAGLFSCTVFHYGIRVMLVC